MAQSSEQRFWCQGVLRFVFAFVSVCLVGYIVGPNLLWRLKEKPTSQSQASCPSCACDCSSETTFLLLPGVDNNTYSDCGKYDPDTNEELEKDIVALLSEEISLQKIVSNDTLERTLTIIMVTKRSSSHYHKEAEKCNAGVETCEEARERAEAELREELKLTALWEKRAQELGWTDSRRVYA